jgi:hypothetical protein
MSDGQVELFPQTNHHSRQLMDELISRALAHRRPPARITLVLKSTLPV